MTKEIGTSTLIDTWATTGSIAEPTLTKKDQGWQLGEQPPHEWMNFLQNQFGKETNYLKQEGVPKWDTNNDYVIGSIVKYEDQLWRSKTAHSASAPYIGSVNWDLFSGGCLNADVTVTVGTGGDFATINDAIKYLSGIKPLYDSTEFRATIDLLAGFVIAEQILVYNLDLSYISITGLGIDIDGTNLTKSFFNFDYGITVYPVFYAFNSKLPLLKFSCDLNVLDGVKNLSFVFCEKNSFCHIFREIDFLSVDTIGGTYRTNTIWAHNGSLIIIDRSESLANVLGSSEILTATEGSYIKCDTFILNWFKGDCIRAENHSKILLKDAILTPFATTLESPGTTRRGVYASNNSSIVWNNGSVGTLTVTTNVLYRVFEITNESSLYAPSFSCTNGTAGRVLDKCLAVLSNSKAYIESATLTSTNDIVYSESSYVFCKSGSFSSSGGSGIFAIKDSHINAELVTVSNATDNGFYVERSYLFALDAVADNCQRGLYAIENAYVLARNLSCQNSSIEGIACIGSFLKAKFANLNNSTNGFTISQGSQVTINGSTYTGSPGYAINFSASFGSATSCDFTSNGAACVFRECYLTLIGTDFRRTPPTETGGDSNYGRGAIVSTSSGLGGSTQPANTLNNSGIRFVS